ncbi:MAG TPA: YceI family protein [Catalimonadaceae bacterium]|nr:YceI family protein [Catalimonadaceae bacterium]HPI10003.1 YceI family protein [Catalimonadaceae bacterium]
MKTPIFAAFLLILSAFAFQQETIYSGKEGTVKFESNAPLELIIANSKQLTGLINTEKRTFVFKVKTSSFQGFKNSMQEEHFNESYMESDKFPSSEFKGKIIEETDFRVPGTYQVRVKGLLTVHGVEKERIIKAKVTVKNKQISIESDFDVLLADHEIKIPKIVEMKIAETIRVNININMQPKS